MIEAFFSNIYAILGTVLLACFGGYIAWRNGHKARIAIACITFRSDVLGALSGLYPIPVNWPDSGGAVNHMLAAAFPALQRAVAEFRDVLPRRKRRGFDKAWHAYRAGSDNASATQQGHYYQYMGYHEPGTSDASGHTKSKGLFHTNVQNLLNFANET